MNKTSLGYIVKINTDLNPNMPKFKFREAKYTRVINSRGDRIKSDMLLYPVDYEDVDCNTKIMKEDGIILVSEPFFLDDELKEKATRWVEWANKVDPSEYDPFIM